MIYAGRIRFKPYINPIKLQGGPFQMVIAILAALILKWNLRLILTGSLFIFDSDFKV